MSAPQRNSISLRQWDTTFRIRKIINQNQDMYIVIKDQDKEIKREKMKRDTTNPNQFNYFLQFQINFACQYQFQIYEGEVVKEKETIWRQFKFDEYGDIQVDDWNKFCIVYRMHATFKGFFTLFEIYVYDKKKKKKIKLEESKSHFPAFDCYEWVTNSERENGERQFVFKCVQNDLQDFCHEFQLKQIKEVSINCFQKKFDKKQLNQNKLSQKLRLILLENIIPDENNMGDDRKNDEKYQQIVYEKERLQIDNQSMKKEIQLLNEKVEQYYNLNEKYQKQIQLAHDMQNKIKETAQLEVNEHNVTVQQLENKIKYLQTQVEKFQNLTLQNQNLNNNDFPLSQQQQDDLLQIIPQEYKEEIQNLFKKILSKKLVLENSENQAQGQQMNSEELEEMCGAYQKKIKKQKQENQDLQDTLLVYENKINQKMREIQDYQETLKLYEKKMREFQKLNKNNQQYQAHIQQIEAYRNKLLEYEEKIKQLIKELEIERKKNDLLVKELKAEQDKIQIEKKKSLEVEQNLKKQIEQQSIEFQQQLLIHKNRIKELDLQQQELNDQTQQTNNNNWQILFDLQTIITEYRKTFEPEEKNKIISAKYFVEEVKNQIAHTNQKELKQFLNQKSKQIREALQENNKNLFSFLFCKRKQKKNI